MNEKAKKLGVMCSPNVIFGVGERDGKWVGLLAGFVLVVVLSFVKEGLDEKRDKKDILAGVLGSMTMVIIYLIKWLC